MVIFRCERSYMKPSLIILAVFISTPAIAYDLTKVMSGKPEARFQSQRSLFEIERCIVMLDLPAQPSVYRTPDKPFESIVHFGTITPMAIQLLQKSDTVDVIIWNGSKFAKRVLNCTTAKS